MTIWNDWGDEPEDYAYESLPDYSDVQVDMLDAMYEQEDEAYEHYMQEREYQDYQEWLETHGEVDEGWDYEQDEETGEFGYLGD